MAAPSLPLTIARKTGILWFDGSASTRAPRCGQRRSSDSVRQHVLAASRPRARVAYDERCAGPRHDNQARIGRRSGDSFAITPLLRIRRRHVGDFYNRHHRRSRLCLA